MTKFHINYKGDVGKCSSPLGKCRFGSEDEHGRTHEETRTLEKERLSSLNNSYRSDRIRIPALDRIFKRFSKQSEKDGAKRFMETSPSAREDAIEDIMIRMTMK